MNKAAIILISCVCVLNGCSFNNNSEPIRQLYDPKEQLTAVPLAPLPEHVQLMQRKGTAPSIEAGQSKPVSPPPAQEKSIVVRKPNKPNNVKGIYVSAWKANGDSLKKLIRLLEETELNAVVIDVKNDSGQITYDSHVPLVDEIDADQRRPIADIKSLLAQLKQKNIYTIARIVAFKDPYLCSVRKDLAMHTKAGEIWRDKKGVAWVDPYNKQVQAYSIAVAKEAAEFGFDEVQFDYVRFPENGKKIDQEVRFQNTRNQSKAEVIRDFLHAAKAEIPKANVSADVFGLTPSISGDMGIGQDWGMLTAEVDYMSPMIYPSHYGTGSLGIKHPDLEPYAIVRAALKDALKKNAQLPAAAQIRPWLQDFTAQWVNPHQTYGTAQVREQVKAAKELGINQFLLWNPSCTYSYRD